jgi:hypothetical protein
MSPAAWAARLARSLRPAETAAPAAPPPAVREGHGQVQAAATIQRPPAPGRRDEPVRLAGRTRRFLKPLVGIDPSRVAVWQRPRSQAHVAAHRADALATGAGAIVVRTSVDEETPEGLGLLAHEQTHVVRHRQPRFVAPVARYSQARVPAHQDEETTARRVESRVSAAARHHAIVNRFDPPVSDAPAGLEIVPAVPLADDPRAEPGRPVPLPAGAVSAHDQKDPASASSPAAHDWGGLPAPWEAMPAWTTSSSTGEQVALPADAVSGFGRISPVCPQADIPYTSPPASTPPAAGLSMQAAEEGRTLERPVHTSAASGGDAASVAPDLDALARQVYAVMKRRLQTELRREQLF